MISIIIKVIHTKYNKWPKATTHISEVANNASKVARFPFNPKHMTNPHLRQGLRLTVIQLDCDVYFFASAALCSGLVW